MVSYSVRRNISTLAVHALAIPAMAYRHWAGTWVGKDWGRIWKRAYLTISHNIQQGNDVGTTRQILQNLDLSLDLLLLDRLEHLDDALLIVDDVDTLENLRVFATT